jgi:hypothetical protein
MTHKDDHNVTTAPRRVLRGGTPGYRESEPAPRPRRRTATLETAVIPFICPTCGGVDIDSADCIQCADSEGAAA